MKTRILPLVLALAMLFGVVHFAHAQTPTSGTVNSSANVRSGPSTLYAVVGSLAAGEQIEIIGCNATCTWYEIGTARWVSASLVTAHVVAPTPTAQPAITASPITIVSWNVESGGALQSIVADRIAAFQDVDIWGLSEVNAIDAEFYEFGAEEGENTNFDALLGTTGRADRLLLLWDAERFARVNSGEMLVIGETGRAPLWVQLREQATGLEFIVMVNHLHRSNDGIRHRQATALNTWAAGQTLPVIAVGDYNFDWNLPNGDADHDRGYDNLVANSVWEWVRPAELVTTQCSGWPCSYNSILDFVFVAGPARDWNIASEIVVTENDFPDDNTTPDHRPVMAVIMPDGVVTAPEVSHTPSPACPQAANNANLRAGPGTEYGVVGSVQQGQCITITGRTEVGDWFQLSSGNWIASLLVSNQPSMDAIPVVAAPALPTAVPPTTAPTVAPPVATQAPPTPVPPAATPAPAIHQAVCDCSGNIYNCPNFNTHAQAQACMNYCIAQGRGDIHRLDGDSDGVACESLP